VFGPDVETAAVVQPAVEALTDHDVDRVAVDGGLGVEVECPAQSALPHRAHGHGAGEQYGALHGPELLELAQTGGLAIAVHHMAGRQDLLRVRVAAVREDRSDPCADGVALRERGMADLHACHVDQRVLRARLEATHCVAELAEALAHG
jgi:hypothetical protein